MSRKERFLSLGKRELLFRNQANNITASIPPVVLMPIHKLHRNSLTFGTNYSSTELASSDAETPSKKKHISRAIAKYVRGAPSKFRRVLNTIRGLSYEEALMILEYMPYRSCEPILKCLLSAASNAKTNYGIKKTKLYVGKTFCDMGPALKRYRPRAQGRGYKIKKHISHITITLEEKSTL